MNYDALLIVSFGGPEKADEVMPFLELVLRGKNIPRPRLLEVAEHYYHFGGASPINQQIRELIQALESELRQHGPHLPIYWGNRNWHPFLGETLRHMQQDGVRQALAFVTSAFSSYSGCRQYREAIEAARQEVGAGAPVIHKMRCFFNHPNFIQAMQQRVEDALGQIPAPRRAQARVVYTAHSIPQSMAQTSRYVEQLQEASRMVSARLGRSDDPLVFQSRSGPPGQPWLEPDILDYLRRLHAAAGACDVVIVPIGFFSDHMEVIYDLDTQARDLCRQLGINMVRAVTAGTHPLIITMIRDLMLERMEEGREKATVGQFGALPDFCPEDCCLPPARPTARRP